MSINWDSNSAVMLIKLLLLITTSTYTETESTFAANYASKKVYFKPHPTIDGSQELDSKTLVAIEQARHAYENAKIHSCQRIIGAQIKILKCLTYLTRHEAGLQMYNRYTFIKQ